MKANLITLLFSAALPFSAYGQNDEIIVTRAQIDDSDPAIVTAMIEILNENSLNLDEDEELRVALRNMMLAVAKNETSKVTHVSKTITLQKFATYIAFLVAHSLLLLGFIVGYVEYKRVKKLRKKGESLDDIEVSIGLESIALKTTLGGALISAFCFGFYALYLGLVFQMST